MPISTVAGALIEFCVDWDDKRSFVVSLAFQTLKAHLIPKGTVIELELDAITAPFYVEKSHNDTNTIGPAALFRIGIYPEKYSSKIQINTIVLRTLQKAPHFIIDHTNEIIELTPIYTQNFIEYKTAIEIAFKENNLIEDNYSIDYPFLKRSKEIIRIYFRKSFLLSAKYFLPEDCIENDEEVLGFDFIMSVSIENTIVESAAKFKIKFNEFVMERYPPLQNFPNSTINTSGITRLLSVFESALSAPQSQCILIKAAAGIGVKSAIIDISSRFGIACDMIDCYHFHEELKKIGFKNVIERIKASVLFFNDLNYCLWENEQNPLSQNRKFIDFVLHFSVCVQ